MKDHYIHAVFKFKHLLSIDVHCITTRQAINLYFAGISDESHFECPCNSAKQDCFQLRVIILEIKYKTSLPPQCIQIYVLYYLVFQYGHGTQHP